MSQISLLVSIYQKLNEKYLDEKIIAKRKQLEIESGEKVQVFKPRFGAETGIWIKSSILFNSHCVISTDGLLGMPEFNDGQSFCLGFHSTSADAAAKILENGFRYCKDPLQDTKNRYGPGIYTTRDLATMRYFNANPTILEVWVHPKEDGNHDLQIHDFNSVFHYSPGGVNDRLRFFEGRRINPTEWNPRTLHYCNDYDILTGPHFVPVDGAHRLAIQCKINPRLYESGRVEFRLYQGSI